MTSNAIENKPAWRSAWHLDDPDWVKGRQRAWKGIKNSPFIKEVLLPNKGELKKIKNFYLIGSAFDPEPPLEDWDWECYHPDTSPIPVTSAMLLELWLTADDSEDNWQHIKDKYRKDDLRSARDRFRDAIYRLYPEHGSIFDGREARIYALLGPTRCRHEDYPGVREEVFSNISKSTNSTLGGPISSHLEAVQPNPDSITPMFAREWCDTIASAYEYTAAEANEFQRPEFLDVFISGLLETVSNCRKIISAPKQFHTTQVELSKRIITYLSETELPKPLLDILGEYLD
jgi:hypothetical protein